MKTKPMLFVAAVALAQTLAFGAYAQTNNETGTSATGAKRPNVTKEERQAARKARASQGKDISSQNAKMPSASEGAPAPGPSSRATAAERAEARKARNANARAISAENERRPVNNETGTRSR